MRDESGNLQLKFDPRTIEHLGIKMYSQLPYALAELVANSYDACAENVRIMLYDNVPSEKRILVADDGEGMSYEEVRDNFLVIGRKRRDSDESRENSKNRKITGKKGLGKLALFGIGKTIRVETTKSGEAHKTIFTLDWENILNEPSGTYYPHVERIGKVNVNEQGTTIILSNLSRISDYDLDATAVSLSKLFNWISNDFHVSISLNNGEPIVLTRELRYQGLDKQFEWDIVDIISNKIDSSYTQKSELKGKIFSSIKPMRQDLRGITLYVNGRLANIPSFFGASEAGHTFSYLSGWIDADFLDEFDKDLISTDRQSLSWDLPEAAELQKCLQQVVRFLVKDWSSKRSEVKKAATAEKVGIDLDKWFEKVPEDMRPKLEGVIKQISDKPQIDNEEFSIVVSKVHDLIPPFTHFHYRELHRQVQDAAKAHYETEDFYVAFQEAMKRYKNAVKDKSGVEATLDLDIVSHAFGKDVGKPLRVTANFAMRPNGKPFPDDTLNGIEEGQRFLSMGAVKGGRNVVSHEEHSDLRDTGLFTEKDCLDLLSLLSHLFKRLDESKKQ